MQLIKRKRLSDGILAGSGCLLFISGILLLIIYRNLDSADLLIGSFGSVLCMAVHTIILIFCACDSGSGVSYYFKTLILLNELLAFSSVVTNVADGKPYLTLVSQLGELILFISVILLSLHFWWFLSDVFHSRTGQEEVIFRKITSVIYILVCLHILLMIINCFGGYIFYIDENGIYYRGPLFRLSWICPILILLLCMILIMREKISFGWKLVYLSFPFLPCAAYPMQIIYPRVMPLCIALTFSMLIMYCVLYLIRSREMNRQKELLVVQEKELLEKEVQLMISQIQPHFIYNTIAMIRSLCREDPEQAAEALGKFSAFLRGSLNMMQENECISIQDELRLVHAYMYLEQMRFGDRIDYMEEIEDMELSDFRLPAMTIEPLLENAVHHGIESREEGGTVTLQIFREEKEYIIEITDDGSGFDTSVPIDEKKHIGIANVRSRLDKMCGGTLTFESTPGEGTIATIRIPDKHL